MVRLSRKSRRCAATASFSTARTIFGHEETACRRHVLIKRDGVSRVGCEQKRVSCCKNERESKLSR